MASNEQVGWIGMAIKINLTGIDMSNLPQGSGVWDLQWRKISKRSSNETKNPNWDSGIGRRLVARPLNYLGLLNASLSPSLSSNVIWYSYLWVYQLTCILPRPFTDPRRYIMNLYHWHEKQTSDDAALNAIVNQILTVKDLDGKLFMDTTTVHPNTTKQTNGKLKKRNASFVAGKWTHTSYDTVSHVLH
jgi:hypothetical protein